MVEDGLVYFRGQIAEVRRREVWVVCSSRVVHVYISHGTGGRRQQFRLQVVCRGHGERDGVERRFGGV